MSVRFEVGDVRFADKQQVVNDITEIIRKRMEAAGVSLAPNQPITLHVTYSEKAGGELRVTNGPFFFGGDTGQRVINTEINATMEMRLADQPAAIWKDDFKADAGGLIDGPVTEPNVRKDAYQSAIRRFEIMAIPTRIANDPDHRLPIRTSL